VSRAEPRTGPGAKHTIRLLAGIVSVILIALAVLLALGDDEAAQRDTDRVERFLAQVAPKKETSTALLSPVSKQWWVLNDGLGYGQLSLPAFEYPKSATWLGFSAGRSQTPKDPTSDYMPATYIGFKTKKAAETYYVRARHNKAGTPVQTSGNIVLISSPAADVDAESFPKTFGTFDGAVEQGTWRWNLTEEATYIVAHSPFPGAAGNFLGDLGISPDRDKPTVWTGRAQTPEQWWEGALDGYTVKNGKKANITQAAFYFASTQDRVCDQQQSQCTVLSNGLLDLLSSGTVSAGDKTIGGLSLDAGATLEDVKPAGEESDIVHGMIPPEAWRNAMLGGQTSQNGILSRLDFRVPSPDEMMLRPHLTKKALAAVR
jgi:hypothetical protein